MADFTLEKSTIDKCDYEGLQLDTRAHDSTEKDLDTTKSRRSPRHGQAEYSDEKNFITETEAREAAGLDDTPESATSTVDLTKPTMINDDDGGAPKPKVQRMCGLRRRYFWTFFGLVLTIITVAAVVGGILGARQSASSAPSNSSTPLGSASDTPGDSRKEIIKSDVMVASPLGLVSYSTNTTGGDDPGNEQSFRLYFQSAHGNIKEIAYNGVLSSWSNATPIFTDARNNTGLAVINYMNDTLHQSSLFYVSAYDGLLQEKRNYATMPAWEPGSLGSMKVQAIGNISVPETNSVENPPNDWDSYRMAAVYSTEFYGGPGARLFYHSLAAPNGTSCVQELIWNQTADTWSLGATLADPYPNSHLAVTIDDSTRMLRLFYSVGNLTLQESFLNISDPNGVYDQGVNIPNLLAHNDADLAVVSVNGTALVYHYAHFGNQGIRELNITGTPGSSEDPEMYNLSSEATVSQPALYRNGQLSLYQPIGATLTTVGGLEPQIYVFWAEQNVDEASGYQALMTVSRSIHASSWPASSYGISTAAVELPLGDNDADP